MSVSGKFVLRVGKDLHKRLKAEALERNESLNSLVLSYLTPGSKTDSTALPSAIIERFQPLGVIQFGSTVTGKSREGSDVDLLIVLRSAHQISRSLYEIWNELELDEIISPHFTHLPKTAKISSLWLEAALFGKVLYEKEDQMSEKLSEIKQAIAEGKYVRKLTHGQPYWLNQEGNKSA